jgi:hypothetical protein
MPRGRTERTPEKGEKFLRKLRSTGGNVSRACKAEGLTRSAAYAWRAVDEVFRAAWDEAVEAGLDDLEQEARRRAFKGTLKPVYYKGCEVGQIREYSDTLMIFLLKGGRPQKFRERVEHMGRDGGPIETSNVDLTDDQRAARIAAILDAARARRDGQASGG